MPSTQAPAVPAAAPPIAVTATGTSWRFSERFCAVTTISSPATANPSVTAVRLARFTASVMECTSGETIACTPQTTASRRAISIWAVSPITGASGRSRATRSAVLPDAVKATIAFAPIV